jgi:histidinol-phosphate aminotransferase
MNTIAISRRKFAQLLGAGAACAVVKPAFSLATEPVAPPVASGVVRLSSNENPYGPSPKALKAMTDSFGLSSRYPDEHNDELIEALAKLNGVNRDQILLGDGSGEILKFCAETFTGPTSGKLVVPDPTFESILHHASVNGAEVVKVPLTPSFAHDLAKMGAAAKDGLIYVCNPNNPTASITPKNELRDFIAKTPRATMILVDEAYFHFADSPDYESVIPLIKDHPNLIVARTFSKIYGMAGLRCGFAIARPDLLAKLEPYGWNSMPVTAVVAAKTSLQHKNLILERKKINADIRSDVFSWLAANNYAFVPSESNCFMVDVKRPGRQFMEAMEAKKVYIGRVWPAWPTHVRVTVGTRPEMEAFKKAFKEAMESSAVAAEGPQKSAETWRTDRPYATLS